MTKHKGEHPRMGALDVCPFIPIQDVTVEECVEISISDTPSTSGSASTSKSVCKPKRNYRRREQSRSPDQGFDKVPAYLATTHVPTKQPGKKSLLDKMVTVH